MRSPAVLVRSLRRPCAALAHACLLLAAVGCTASAPARSGPPSSGVQAPPAVESARVLLLGEVHDNPEAHRARLALLRARVDAGWRPVIAMEQFDRERQGELDRAAATCRDADCVVRAAAPARSGWDWPLYAPLIELALAHRLPLVAANLSASDAMRVAREGFTAALDPATIASYRLGDALPADLASGQREAIRLGHCDLLPASMLDGMARAQVARDVWMAETVRRHAARGVVLVAGNGHLRADLGVPRWLDAATRGDTRVVAFVEADDDGRYDETRRVPAQPRPDPCAQLRSGARGR